MLIPFQAEIPIDREPRANFIFLIIMVIFFLLSIIFDSPRVFELRSNNTVGLVLHMFAHGGFLHFIGNAIFLWTFGNALNDRLGNIIYTVLFLALGTFAGVGHLILDGSPAIGASGAISGIMGIFLILYPKEKIMCLVIFNPIGFGFLKSRISLSALYLIASWVIIDLIESFTMENNIAYMAHLSGYTGGILIGLYIKSQDDM